MSALGAFLSTWAKARATFGSGTPAPGTSYDQSSTLSRLTDDLDLAMPARYWSGDAPTVRVYPPLDGTEFLPGR